MAEWDTIYGRSGKALRVVVVWYRSEESNLRRPPGQGPTTWPRARRAQPGASATNDTIPYRRAVIVQADPSDLRLLAGTKPRCQVGPGIRGRNARWLGLKMGASHRMDG